MQCITADFLQQDFRFTDSSRRKRTRNFDDTCITFLLIIFIDTHILSNQQKFASWDDMIQYVNLVSFSHHILSISDPFFANSLQILFYLLESLANPVQSAENTAKVCHRYWLCLHQAEILIWKARTTAPMKVSWVVRPRTNSVQLNYDDRKNGMKIL